MGLKTKLYRNDRVELVVAGQSSPILIDICDIQVRSGKRREEVMVNITAPRDVRINKTQRPK